MTMTQHYSRERGLQIRKLQQGFTIRGMGPGRHFAQQQRSGSNVRFGSKADMCSAQAHVRFTPESDIKCDMVECALWADGGRSWFRTIRAPDIPPSLDKRDY